MKLSRDINNTMLTILLLSFLCSFTLSARMPRRRMGVTVKVSDLVQGQSQVTTVSSNAAVQVKKDYLTIPPSPSTPANTAISPAPTRKPLHGKLTPRPRSTTTSSPSLDTNTINICYDCDGPCAFVIATTPKFRQVDAYFTAVTKQLNQIMKNSDMPIAIVTHKITNTSGDFVLDPKGKKDVAEAMDGYWTSGSPSRFESRRSDGCTFSFFVTEDPIFIDGGPAGMAYANSLCTQYSFGIGRVSRDINTMAARVAHELLHAMYVNHVRDGEISYPDDFGVKASCYPDICNDPTGMCISISSMPKTAPTMLSQCERAMFFAWRKDGNGHCIGIQLGYYERSSGDAG